MSNLSGHQTLPWYHGAAQPALHTFKFFIKIVNIFILRVKDFGASVTDTTTTSKFIKHTWVMCIFQIHLAFKAGSPSLVYPGKSTWTDALIPVPRLVGQEWMKPYLGSSMNSLPER